VNTHVDVADAFIDVKIRCGMTVVITLPLQKISHKDSFLSRIGKRMEGLRSVRLPA